MGFTEGEIILDSPNGSYYAGQTIFGKLVFEEDKIKQFRGIYVKCKGYCKVQWTTSYTRTVDGERKTFHENHESEEEYIHIKVYLVGGESGEYTLQPGRHEFPFQFLIPQNCPSSFEGSKGHIRYEIKAVMDRAFKLDHEITKEVTVIAMLDLNADPYCKEPMVFEFNETYCCCCISSGSSETVIKLPASGFCPGQVVPVEIGCSTKGSSVEISEIKFRIVKTISYNAVKNPAMEAEKEKFAKTITGPVAADSIRNWTVNLDIPDIAVGSVDTCKFIDIQYELKVTIVPDGCQSNSDESRRIVIGNTQLVGFTDNSQNVTAPIQAIPIITQPLSMASSPYPSQNPSQMYPGSSPLPYPPHPTPNTYLTGNTPCPYPTGDATNPINTVNPPYPSGNSPYPGGNPPGNSPYPGGNPPYAGGNPPYSAGNSPYPGGNPPYSTVNSPYPGGNPPYPVGNAPYPAGNSPYPTAMPYSAPSQNTPPQQNTPYQSIPNPVLGGSLLKTGTVGFTVQSPGMPPLPNPVPATNITNNPYATASAPQLD